MPRNSTAYANEFYGICQRTLRHMPTNSTAYATQFLAVCARTCVLVAGIAVGAGVIPALTPRDKYLSV